MASALASSLQQMALSFGLAGGSLIAAWFLDGHPQSDHAAIISALHGAFVTLGILTMFSSLFFRLLHPRDGESVSRANLQEMADKEH
jgi:hypothetical protein